jgi:PAS domain S-box-containing protein
VPPTTAPPVNGTESRWQDSDETYRLMFNHNPRPMWVYDSETLRFLVVNEAAIRTYGFSREEFLTRTILDIRPATEVPKLLAQLKDFSKPLQEEGDWIHRIKNGSLVRMEIASHALSFGGRPGRLVLATDVTAHDLRHQEISRVNSGLERKVLERTQQVEAALKELETFSYAISHDLRAPLRGIAGYCDELLRSHTDQLNTEGQRLLKVVFSEALNMGILIENLLAFSKAGRQPMDAQDIDMTELAQGTFNDLVAPAPQLSPRFNLRPLPAARGDRSMLRQVFANLLGNAIKYSRRHPAAAIEVGATIGKEENTYYVRDNGVGFDPAHSSGLFGLFQRLHGVADFEGTGVGLALVQCIIRRHGGKVWAEGALNAGATFYFTLPAGKVSPS